jgi:hypothetical protein
MATPQQTITGATGTLPNTIAAFPRNTTQITQANMATQPIRPPEVIHRLSFSSENIKRLTAEDFDLNSKELVALKYDDCVLVLFHVENTESYQLADIWALVAQQVAGPVFAAVNMLSERKVAEAFTRLKADGSNPLHWAALRQYPFILVYRKGWPVAVYNGPREVQALIDYALTLACEAGYYEITQLGGSMEAEGRIEMGPYDVYTNIPGRPPRVRRESLQYNAEEPIRGFNPNIPIVITGSTGAQRATSQIRAEELQQQQGAAEGVNTSLTQEEEQRPTLEQITGEPTTTQPAVQQPAPVATPTATQPQVTIPTPTPTPTPAPAIAVPATTAP